MNAADFGRVFDMASRSRDRLFTVLYRRGAGTDARLGMAIAKKHCRKATARNRLKRVIRESFRHHQHELAGIDIVVLNKPGTHLASAEQLADSLAAHWDRCSHVDKKRDG